MKSLSHRDRVGVNLPPPRKKKEMIIEKGFEKLVNNKRHIVAQNFTLKNNKKQNNRLELHQWSNDGVKHTIVVIKFYYMDHNWTLYCIDDNNVKYSLMCSTHAYFNPNYQDKIQSRDDIINLLDRRAKLIAYFEDDTRAIVVDAPAVDVPAVDAAVAELSPR